MSKPKDILICVDAPDPDNFVLLVAVARLFPEAQLYVLLTGRPVNFKATRETPLWDIDRDSSIMALEASAARMKNFMRHFGLDIVRVYDGGVAPRTLVPHWIHFSDYYKFLDVDPLAALRYSELDSLSDLTRILLNLKEFAVVVGGPMTGLHQLLTRNPSLAKKITEVHAMFGTWGNVQLMQMDDKPRGTLQFNVACDPGAAHFVLSGLDCPIYLMPSEVTRVGEIGFVNAVELRNTLPDNKATRALFNLYAIWHDAAVKPRQTKNPDEKIFIHDLVSALSLDHALRDQIYDVVPIEVTDVSYLPNEEADWGKLLMREVTASKNRFAAKTLKPGGAEVYLKTLYDIFR